MITLASYKKHVGSNTLGEIRKQQSDMILDATWWGDINAKHAFIYDFYHDNEPTKFIGLAEYGTPIDIKLMVNSYNAENKDQQGYHVQFRPNHKCQLDYYEEYVKLWGTEYPIGLYLSIPDEQGVLRKWMITEPANHLMSQFPTWYALPIDHVFQWIANGERHQMCGVGRSQSSYNSGVYTNYKLEIMENQKKCILPMNKDSATLYYNHRIIISEPLPTPLAWRCSKIENTEMKGISVFTFAQDVWNSSTDYVEKSDDGSVIGMWANYYDDNGNLSFVESDDDDVETVNALITCAGSQEIKIKGSYKKFTVDFYRNDNIIEHRNGSWTFMIDGLSVADLISTSTNSLDSNQIKIKFVGDDTYIGKLLTVRFVSEFGEQSDIQIPIVSL